VLPFAQSRSGVRAETVFKGRVEDKHLPTGDQMRQVISQTLDPFLRLLLPGGRVAPLYLTSRIGIGANK